MEGFNNAETWKSTSVLMMRSPTQGQEIPPKSRHMRNDGVSRDFIGNGVSDWSGSRKELTGGQLKAAPSNPNREIDRHETLTRSI